MYNMYTKVFTSESSSPLKIWILSKLYEFCQSCRRNPLYTFELKSIETLESHALVNMLLCSSHFTEAH